MTLGPALKRLGTFYGRVELREPTDPFELVLWENAAYLVDDATRARTFAELRRLIGTAPAAILTAAQGQIIEAIRGGGMQPAHRAQKIRRSAETAVESADGDLASALRGLSPQKARTLLKRFPGIGEPGADKILLLCGFAVTPSLESNGLRVLARLGLIREDKSYVRTYQAGTVLMRSEGFNTRTKATRAFALLREHGRELCKRTSPICAACPLEKDCAYARSL